MITLTEATAGLGSLQADLEQLDFWPSFAHSLLMGFGDADILIMRSD
jgi:hypothetical protein